MSHTTCLKTEVAQLLLQLALCFPLGSTCGLQGGQPVVKPYNSTTGLSESVVFKPHMSTVMARHGWRDLQG